MFFRNPDSMSPRDMLDAALFDLIASEPFYSVVLSRMNKRIVPPEDRIKTAAVGISREGALQLYVNREFFGGLPHDQRVAVLKHEVLHVVHRHLLVPPTSYPDRDLANRAMDIAINQYIHNLPDFALMPNSYDSQGVFLDRYQATAYYYQVLLRAKEEGKLGQGGEGEGEGGEGQGAGGGVGKVLDDHSVMGPAPGMSDDLAKAVVENAIAKAVAECEKTGKWGSVPGGLRDRIKASLKAKVDWRREMNKFASGTTQSDWEPTRMRQSRRFGWDFYGQKPTEQSRLLVAVDTSGSVGSSELSQFLTEISRISEFADVVVAEIDDEIQNVWEYSPAQRAAHEFKGRGGTSFRALRSALLSRGANVPRTSDIPDPRTGRRTVTMRDFSRQLREAFNGIIYLTDGEGEFPKDYLGIPTLWVITTDVKAPFGRTIKISLKEASHFNPRSPRRPRRR